MTTKSLQGKKPQLGDMEYEMIIRDMQKLASSMFYLYSDIQSLTRFNELISAWVNGGLPDERYREPLKSFERMQENMDSAIKHMDDWLAGGSEKAIKVMPEQYLGMGLIDEVSKNVDGGSKAIKELRKRTEYLLKNKDAPDFKEKMEDALLRAKEIEEVMFHSSSELFIMVKLANVTRASEYPKRK